MNYVNNIQLNNYFMIYIIVVFQSIYVYYDFE